MGKLTGLIRAAKLNMFHQIFVALPTTPIMYPKTVTKIILFFVGYFLIKTNALMNSKIPTLMLIKFNALNPNKICIINLHHYSTLYKTPLK